jgi:hypothetical protein
MKHQFIKLIDSRKIVSEILIFGNRQTRIGIISHNEIIIMHIVFFYLV